VRRTRTVRRGFNALIFKKYNPFFLLQCTNLDELMKLAFMFQQNNIKRLHNTHDIVPARIYKIMKSKIEPLRIKYKLNVNNNLNKLKKKWLEKLEKSRLIRRSKDNKLMRKQSHETKQKRLEWLKEQGIAVEQPEKIVKKVLKTSEKLAKISSAAGKVVKQQKSAWTVTDLAEESVEKEEESVEPEIVADNVDNFFITKTGENYVSSFVTTKREPINSSRQRQKPQFMSMTKHGRNDKVNGRDGNKWKSNDSSRNFNNKPERPMKQQFSKPKDGYKPKVAAPEINTADLHPSWAAKLNAKPLISDFKGTKIVFDD
jgi:hypothetical protein